MDEEGRKGLDSLAELVISKMAEIGFQVQTICATYDDISDKKGELKTRQYIVKV